MSTTALVWLTGYTSGAILAFVNPAYGLFAYYLEYYGHPPYRWWGEDLPQLRWSLIIAMVTFAAYLVRRSKLPELEIKSHPQTIWLILFILTGLLVTPTAVWQERSWKFILILVKYAVLYFLIIKTIRTKEHFRYLILIQVLGVFWWGWNAFENPERVDGRLRGIGGTDSFSDNATAAHLLLVLPFIGVTFLKGKWWEKAVCLVAAPFVVNVFILCNSRGGFVALLIAGIVGVLITHGAFRRKILLGMVMGGILFYSLMDPQFIVRQRTTLTQQEDTSASQRIESWKGALKLIRDHPLGTGGGGFMALSPIYIPEVVKAHEGEMRNVHNTYLQVASEWGVLGLIFFSGFLISTLRELHRMRQNSPMTSEEDRLQAESVAIEISLVGLMIAGMFITRIYAEAFYWLAAFTAVLRNIYANELKKATDR